MIERLPSDLRPVLREIERLASERSTATYLVGGVVRDRLLGRPLEDVDLAVEGDAVGLAQAAAGRLAIEVRAHERFGTASIALENGHRIDLAATRRERYPGMAALPTVEPAPLSEDLFRRDFTVNSMAVPLGASEAEVIDPTGGRDDLGDRALRVHHDRSFLDDPTRILRGARFEARLGFNLEARSESLAMEACEVGAIGLLSAERLGAEIRVLLGERSDPEIAWRRLTELGVVEAAGLRSTSGVEAAALLGRVHRQLEGWPGWHPRSPSVPRGRALCHAVLLAERPGDRSRVAERLDLPVGRAERFERLLDRLSQPELLPHQAADAFDELSIEELVAVDALGCRRASARVAEYLRDQRGFELAIDGATLLAHGFGSGPEIGHALRATRNARLDGLITVGEELAFALAALRGENRGGEPTVE